MIASITNWVMDVGVNLLSLLSEITKLLFDGIVDQNGLQTSYNWGRIGLKTSTTRVQSFTVSNTATELITARCDAQKKTPVLIESCFLNRQDFNASLQSSATGITHQMLHSVQKRQKKNKKTTALNSSLSSANNPQNWDWAAYQFYLSLLMKQEYKFSIYISTQQFNNPFSCQEKNHSLLTIFRF